MKPQAILIELLARLGSQQGEKIFITEDELNIWPNAAVMAMKSYGLITKTLSAKSTLCIGCEQQCIMPVQILINKSGEPRPFIVCDKRSDINRVPIPLNHLELWQLTMDSIAVLLAKLLDIPHTKTGSDTVSQWEIGIFKGKQHSSHLVLLSNDILRLVLAGYDIPLIEVLSFEGTSFKIDKQKLAKLVDNSFVREWGCEKEIVASIRVNVAPDLGYVSLSYQNKTNGQEWENFNYQIPIVWVDCSLGGRRPWFICPVKKCGHRAALLYAGSVFACRRCYNLVYQCQRETTGDRASRQAEKIRDKLKWMPGILNGEEWKPKGMHWKTFERLYMKHEDLVQIALLEARLRFGSAIDDFL